MRQTTGIIILEVLTGLVLLVALAFGALAWRLSSGPIDVTFLKQDIQAALTEARDGRKVTIGGVKLQLVDDQSTLALVANEITFFDTSGINKAGTASAAEIDLDASALLFGTVRLNEITLKSGTLQIVRYDTGLLEIAGEEIKPIAPLHFYEADDRLLYIEQSLMNVLSTLGDRLSGQSLRSMRVEDFSFIYRDEPLGLEWTGSNVSAEIEKVDDRLNMTADASVSGDLAPQTLSLNASFDPVLTELDARLAIDGMAENGLDSLREFGVSGLDTSDIDLEFFISIEQFGISRLAVALESEPTTVNFGDQILRLGRNTALIEYEIESDLVRVDASSFALNQFSGDGILELRGLASLLTAEGRAALELSVQSETLNIDWPELFQSTLSLNTLDLSGTVPSELQSFDIEELQVRLGEAMISATGEIYLPGETSDEIERKLPVGVRLNATTVGALSAEQVLSFWPERLGAGARAWISQNVRTAAFENMDFELDLRPDSFAEGFLADEALRLDFTFRNANVKFLSDLPPALNGSGSARLTGNAFSLDVDQAEFSEWQIMRGQVELPYFNPKGGPLTVWAEGSGEVSPIIRSLARSRLQLEAENGLDASDYSGRGSARFELERPALSTVDYDQTRFRAIATVFDAGVRDTFNGIDLTDTRATVTVDNDSLVIEGYGEFGGAPTEFRWQDDFRSEANNSSRLRARTIAGPDLINEFGVAARAYMQGDSIIELSAEGASGFDFETVLLNLDLENARLDFSEFGWLKERGAPGDLSLELSLGGDNRSTKMALVSNDLQVAGDVTFADDEAISSVVLDQFTLEGQADVQGKLTRDAQSGIDLELTGDYLNVAPLVEGILSNSGGAIPIFGQLRLTSEIDVVELREGFSLSAAGLSVVFDGPRLLDFSMSGNIETGGQVSIDMNGEAESAKRTLVIQSDEAGGLIEGFFGVSFVEGGSLLVEGDLGEVGEPALFNVQLNNTRFQRAPLLTQILSLASLRGLSDVMSGEGILFTNVDIPVRVEDSGYVISGARASGPALGLTARGYVESGGKGISIDGVLVPSFGVNSALGGIPILGDLFVSREGEGVFAITYNVRGSLDEARVAVNPLSGILPGVLRRIFENPGTAELPIPDE